MFEVAGLIPKLNNVFFTGVITGEYNLSQPIEIAKEVVNTLPNDICAFMFAHDQSGVRLVYGYVYSCRRYGVIFIDQFSWGTMRIDINDGEYTLV